MVTPTNVRSGLSTALLATPQAAKGTAATDFTVAASVALRASEPDAMIAPVLPNVATMDVNAGLNSDASYAMPIVVEGVLPVYATSQSAELLLESNYGPLAAGTFTLKTGIDSDRWLSIAWVEHVTDTAHRVAVLRDVWVHKLAFEAELGQGPVVARAHYAGINSTVPTRAASGLTLPAAPMTPSGQYVFPPQLATLTKDPTGTPVTFRVQKLALIFDQGLGRIWTQDAQDHLVYKRGKMVATVDAWLDWSDEAWAVLDDMRANTARRYRVQFTAENGTVLRADLYNFTANVDKLSRKGLEVEAFHLSGSAANDGTNHITLTLG